MFYSCGGTHAKLLQRLIQMGADPNVYVRGHEFYTPLMTAIWYDSPEAAKALIVAGAKVTGPQGYAGETPLTLAARGGPETAPVVELLLDKGAEVNAANDFGLTALMDATHKQPVATIALLIQRGAETDGRDHLGRTALFFASERGNVAAVRILVEAHADVKARASNGDTPLSVAQNDQIQAILRQAATQ